MPPGGNVLPAIPRPPRRRSPPRPRDRRGAWCRRPVRIALGRTPTARPRCRHRARPRSTFRPPPSDSFPRAASRARRAPRSWDRPSQAFPAAQRFAYRPGRLEHRGLLDDRSPSADNRPRTHDRAARRPPEPVESVRESSRNRAVRAVGGQRHRFQADLFRAVMVGDPTGRSPRANSSLDNATRASNSGASTRRRSRAAIDADRLATAIRPLVYRVGSIIMTLSSSRSAALDSLVVNDPPSIAIVSPLIDRPLSDARNTAAAAISRDFNRATHWDHAEEYPRIAGSSSSLRVNGVSTSPGAIRRPGCRGVQVPAPRSASSCRRRPSPRGRPPAPRPAAVRSPTIY